MSIVTLLTTQGRSLLAAAVANTQTLPSVKIAVGDGNGSVYVPNEAQTALVHEVWRGNGTVARTEDRVIFQATIPANIGGFMVREVGVFIGTVGAEQLFIVSQHPVTEKIATPNNGAGPLPLTVQFSASSSEIAALPVANAGNAVLNLSRPPHITVDGLVGSAPVSPVDGNLYAIASGATGIFTGRGGYLAERVQGAWVYALPPEKTAIRLTTTGVWYERIGTDWTGLTFDDTSVAWAQLTGVPDTFPPSTHNHDDRYVKKSGDSMSGELLAGAGVRASAAVSASNPTAGSAAAAGLRVTNADPSYGLNMGARPVTGAAWLQAQRFDGPGTLYDIVLNPLGGNVGIGGDPAAKLDINGSMVLRGNVLGSSAASVITFGADPAGTLTAGGFVQTYGQAHPTNPGRLSLGSGGVERVGIVAGGALALSGAFGGLNNVVAANGSGQAGWKSFADLLTVLQYELRVVADWVVGTTGWAKISLNTEVANTIAGASTASGVVTLPAGTYEAELRCTLGGDSAMIGSFRARLRDTTNGQTLVVTAKTSTNTITTQTHQSGASRFTLGAAANVEMQVLTPVNGMAYYRAITGADTDYHNPATLIIRRIG